MRLDNVVEITRLKRDRRIEPIARAIQAHAHNAMIEDAGGCYAVIEKLPVRGRDQSSARLQSHSSRSRDVQFRRVLAVAEPRTPDRFEFTRRQPTFTKRDGKIAQFPLYKAQPFGGALLQVLMRRCQTINFLGERSRKSATLIMRREQASHLAPAFEFTELQCWVQNEPWRS